MSDSDSDWGSDDDHAHAPTQPQQAKHTPVVEKTVTVQDEPSPAAGPSFAPGPLILFASPCTVTSSSSFPAGFTILAEHTQPALKAPMAFTLLMYDQNRRPLAAQTVKGDKGEFPISDAEFSLDGLHLLWRPAASVASRFSLTMPNQATLMTCQFIFALAQTYHRLLLSPTSGLLYFSPLSPRPNGAANKLLRPAYFAKVRVTLYPIQMDRSINKMQMEELCKSFRPRMDVAGCEEFPLLPLFSIEVSDVALPDEGHYNDTINVGDNPDLMEGLSVALGRKCRLFQDRLLILPSSSLLVHSCHDRADRLRPDSAGAPLYAVMVRAIDVSKKKEKKKILALPKPVDDGKQAADKHVDAPAPVAAAQQQEAAKAKGEENGSEEPVSAAEPVEAAAVPSSEPATPAAASSSPSSSADPLATLGDALISSIEAAPRVQNKLLKVVLNEMFQGVIDDFNASESAAKESRDAKASVPAVAASSSDSSSSTDPAASADPSTDATDPSNPADPSTSSPQPQPDPEPELSTEDRLTQCLQFRMRAMLNEFQSMNSRPQTGTLSDLIAVMEEFKEQLATARASSSTLKDASTKSSTQLSSALHSLDAARTEAAGQRAKAEAADREAAQTRTELDAVKARLKELQGEREKVKRVYLDQLGELNRISAELKEKSAMCGVFEGGLTQMREMLEKEIHEKNDARKSFQDLQLIGDKLKHAWIREDLVRFCMNAQCRKEFKKTFGFGPSKVHCRMCGRVFCSSHCGGKYMADLSCIGLPRGELFKVCVDCHDIANGQGKETRQEKEETEKPSAVRSARSSSRVHDEDADDDPAPSRSRPKAKQSTGFDDLDSAFD